MLAHGAEVFDVQLFGHRIKFGHAHGLELGDVQGRSDFVALRTAFLSGLGIPIQSGGFNGFRRRLEGGFRRRGRRGRRLGRDFFRRFGFWFAGGSWHKKLKIYWLEFFSLTMFGSPLLDGQRLEKFKMDLSTERFEEGCSSNTTGEFRSQLVFTLPILMTMSNDICQGDAIRPAVIRPTAITPNEQAGGKTPKYCDNVPNIVRPGRVWHIFICGNCNPKPDNRQGHKENHGQN